MCAAMSMKKIFMVDLKIYLKIGVHVGDQLDTNCRSASRSRGVQYGSGYERLAHEDSYRIGGDSQQSKCLSAMARRGEMGWPSPSSRDHKGAPASRCTPEGYNARLDEAVILHGPADPASPNLPGSHPESLATENASFNPLAGNWQTATVSTGAHRQKNGSMIPKLDTQVGGKLNPRWVETLMGLPVGWTMPSCACPVTIAPTSCDS